MAKYSYKFKLKVVQEYLNGYGGFSYLANKYGIPQGKMIHVWVTAYKEFGEEGLLRKRKNNVYSFDFKMYVVELYLTSDISYQDLALSIGVNNPSLITKWVNDYRVAGPDALKLKRKGRKPKMSKVNDKKSKESKNNNDEYLKQLEEENLKLRIENAYLKELRRLRKEGIPQKKKRE